MRFSQLAARLKGSQEGSARVWGRVGLWTILVAIPVQFAVGDWVGGALFAWPFAGAGFLLCATDPRLRRGAIPAAALFAITAGSSILAISFTAGTSQGVLGRVGGPDLGWLAGVIPVAIVAPLAVMLALTREATQRRLAVVALGLSALVVFTSDPGLLALAPYPFVLGSLAWPSRPPRSLVPGQTTGE
jgi:hypothetical protein